MKKADILTFFIYSEHFSTNALTHPSGTFILFAILITCRHFHHLDKMEEPYFEIFFPIVNEFKGCDIYN